jgi:hypothetical protein
MTKSAGDIPGATAGEQNEQIRHLLRRGQGSEPWASRSL